jgi:hypothetical protein
MSNNDFLHTGHDAYYTMFVTLNLCLQGEGGRILTLPGRALIHTLSTDDTSVSTVRTFGNSTDDFTYKILRRGHLETRDTYMSAP